MLVIVVVEDNDVYSVLVGRLLLPLLVLVISAVDAGRRPDNECSVLVGIVVAAVGVCVSAVDVTLVEAKSRSPEFDY